MLMCEPHVPTLNHHTQRLGMAISQDAISASIDGVGHHRMHRTNALSCSSCSGADPHGTLSDEGTCVQVSMSYWVDKCLDKCAGAGESARLLFSSGNYFLNVNVYASHTMGDVNSLAATGTNTPSETRTKFTAALSMRFM